jgi:hypothetical protein
LSKYIGLGPLLIVSVFTIAGPAAGGVGSGTFSLDMRIYVNGANLTGLPSPTRLGPGATITYKSNYYVGLFGTVKDLADFNAFSDKPASENSQAPEDF